ncbi:MAG: PD-(D/E)XK nuclease family protein [Cytophagales bacterium]|nr:MAG: PD-(D/E)XK nuclease family protein [Cytophagales bacterium]
MLSTPTFLDRSAEYLHKKYGTSIDNICLIVPNRRNGVVLEMALEKYYPPTKKNSKICEIIDIENFISETVGWKAASPVVLLLELFEIFKEFETNTKLEKFTGWGHILLKDFDLIDRNLVDAENLFENLQQLKDLDNWKLAEPTTKMKDYYKLWDNLSKTYHIFLENLKKDNIGYSGMIYRELAENLEKYFGQKSIFTQYIFVGFNALSQAEEKIFDYLLTNQKGEVLWDSDTYYLETQKENKAGLFLRNYKRKWGAENWNFEENILATTQKNITVIKTNNASQQGRVANQILKQWQSENNGNLIQTGLVLGDEQLLLSTLSSLDKCFENQINISIGLSLKDSAIFNLVDVLFEQQQLVIRDKEKDLIKFSHRTITKLFNHPFLRQYEKRKTTFENDNTNIDNEKIKTETRSLLFLLTNFIHKENLIFLNEEDIFKLIENPKFIEKAQEEEGLYEYCQLANEMLLPVWKILFTHWKRPKNALENLLALQKLIYEEGIYFESAYLLEFERILTDLQNFINQRPNNIDLKTFKIFLYQAFRESKFDFEGDKSTPLQIMGLNETRNLDFKNLIILSVNEGSIPRRKKIQSFIPLDIAAAKKIPTYQEQEAIVSYYFYRALQRAENIFLVNVAPSDTYGGNEKSRFILQLENDLCRYNPKINYRTFKTALKPIDALPEVPLVYEKDENLIKRIKMQLLAGTTPSQINDFITCGLKYYFSHICKLKSLQKAEELMTGRESGVIIHEILEDVFKELAYQHNNFVEAKHIETIIDTIPQKVDEKFKLDRYVGYQITGKNFVIKETSINIIQEFLKAQVKEIQQQGIPFEILTLENQEAEDLKHHTTLSVEVDLAIRNENVTILLKGITDRIDKIAKKVRIIDYKTEKVDKAKLSLSKEDINQLIEDAEKGKARQVWLYKYIIAKQIVESKGKGYKVGDVKLYESDDLSTGIYSLRNLEEGFLELNCKETQLLPPHTAEYVLKSEEYLATIIGNILNPDLLFERTDNIKHCQYCSFSSRCGRG